MTGNLCRGAGWTAAILLVVHSALLAWSATRHSPSIDEVGHMAAGLSHWQVGAFDLYRVNPPLVRLVATAPVTLLKPVTSWEGVSVPRGGRPEFPCGEQFVLSNGERSRLLFIAARWTCIPFSLLGGWICYRWAGELYGALGGLLSLTLWCFSPNVLAHALMITPDVGATAVAAAACWLFWHWLRSPSLGRAIGAGLLLGFAELAKATFLALYVVWPLAWAAYLWDRRRRCLQPDYCLEEVCPRTSASRQAAHLALMAALSVYIINLGYGFEGSFRPLGEFDFVSETLGGAADLAHPESWHHNRFASTPLANFRVPLPANFLLGIDQQKHEFEQGFLSYLHGEWRHGGWWYYYLYGLAIKEPLGVWLLLVLSLADVVYLVLRRRRGVYAKTARADANGIGPGTTLRSWGDEISLLLPAAIILALVSSQTGFNHHLRYVLPVFPFIFVWIGRLGSVGTSSQWTYGQKVVRVLIAVGLGWYVGSSLWYYPHSLSYFNELVGGPLGGRWHLLDSNLDWGQDLFHLKSWLDDHPEAKPLGLAYFGKFDPRSAGIEFEIPPRGPVSQDDAAEAGRLRSLPPKLDEELGPKPGWYAISVMMLHGFEYGIPDGRGGNYYADEPYFSYFQRLEPVARAGYSIYIYHVSPTEANRLRRELGLRPWRSNSKMVRQSKPSAFFSKSILGRGIKAHEHLNSQGLASGAAIAATQKKAPGDFDGRLDP